MKPLDEAMRRADENALEAYRGMPAGSRDFDTVQCVTKAALASLAHQGWVLVPREALEATNDQAIALTVGSCSCGMKSPNAALHPAECRYVTASGLLENIEEMLAAAPKTGETT